ncbi:hypothetical protein [Streptomyces sp. NPDC101234]|uniref:hypothetical protein n=1 Tax=Streptomyces sp. NPDC101234 TaxID=3366138 RepID=UPI00380DE85F
MAPRAWRVDRSSAQRAARSIEASLPCAYADRSTWPLPPARHVAVLACVDARLNVYAVLGADERRSLAVSRRLRGTEEIILIHHTDCGMPPFTDDGFTSRPIPSSSTWTPSADSSSTSPPAGSKRSNRWDPALSL